MQNLGMDKSPPALSAALDSNERLFYSGSSMSGTFRNGDWLIVEPASLAALRPGDVVVYRRPADWKIRSERIVHRVMAVVNGGVILRGDFNPRSDIDVIFEDDLLGRVTHFQRSGRVRPVTNGLPGLVRGRLLHLWYGGQRALWWGLLWLVRVPYRWLKRSGIVRRLWQPQIQRIRLQSPDGMVIKYVWRGRTVARFWPQQRLMVWQRPFDLVILHPLDPRSQSRKK